MNQTEIEKAVATALAANGVKKPQTEQERIREQVLNTLQQLGRLTVPDDGIIFAGDRVILPTQFEGNPLQGATFIKKYVESQNAEFEFTRTFQYRPYDGAAAFQRAMQKVFGTSGIGQVTRTMFGTQLPEYRTVPISASETIQVPWGRVELPILEAVFAIGGVMDREWGVLSHITVEAPRKYRQHIEAFFAVIEDELKQASIYKGKAITGSQMDPQFLNVSTLDPRKVVYSDEVFKQLAANVWTLIKHTDKMRELNISLKRAFLVEGPYGTGKTLCGLLTAQVAQRHGWTFIMVRPGQDDMFEVLKTAQLYAPAVVWIEDVDVVASDGSRLEISRLLDALDGITNKLTPVMIGFTTNHADQLQKGVLRPGRIDSVIHIGGLDAPGFERLIKVLVPERLLSPSIDYVAVGAAFEGLVPAFAVEAIGRATRYSLANNDGVEQVLTTEDFVAAAAGLKPQLALMEQANEGDRRPTLDALFQDRVKNVLQRTFTNGWSENFITEDAAPGS